MHEFESIEDLQLELSKFAKDVDYIFQVIEDGYCVTSAQNQIDELIANIQLVIRSRDNIDSAIQRYKVYSQVQSDSLSKSSHLEQEWTQANKEQAHYESKVSNQTLMMLQLEEKIQDVAKKAQELQERALISLRRKLSIDEESHQQSILYLQIQKELASILSKSPDHPSTHNSSFLHKNEQIFLQSKLEENLLERNRNEVETSELRMVLDQYLNALEKNNRIIWQLEGNVMEKTKALTSLRSDNMKLNALHRISLSELAMLTEEYVLAETQNSSVCKHSFALKLSQLSEEIKSIQSSIASTKLEISKVTLSQLFPQLI